VVLARDEAQTLAAKLEKLEVFGVIVHPTPQKLEVHNISWTSWIIWYTFIIRSSDIPCSKVV
jgi:hypothetical protein